MRFLVYVQLAGGFIYLLMGADLLVRGAVSLGRKIRVAPMVVAFTVVAFGTSMPELVVSLRAALTGLPGLAIGNVVGSNIANVLMVVGVAAILYPMSKGEGPVKRDSAIMMAFSVLFAALCLQPGLGRGSGLLLLVGLVIVSGVMARDVAVSYRTSERGQTVEWTLGLPSRGWLIALFLVVGLAGLPLGARLVVQAAAEIAEQLGVTETVVGLTILAFSTSLPELATAVVAALRRRNDVALGTVIGSNVLNIVAIMGLTATLSPTPIPVPPMLRVVDLPVMLGAALLMTVFVWRDRPIGRRTGVVLTVAYVLYILSPFVGPGR